jgi:hypothetical protein
VNTFLAERRAVVAAAPFYKRRRPATLRALGHMLHPEAITEAWYAAQCPPRLTRTVPGRVWLRWRLAVLLRGADR